MTDKQFLRHVSGRHDRATAARPSHSSPPLSHGPPRTSHKIVMVISGGQTGVDRAALHAAQRHGIAYGGWVPAGGLTEDANQAPGIRSEFPLLVETPTADPAERTELNVRDSDATLIVTAADVASPGTALTKACTMRHAKACFVTDGSDSRKVAQWLDTLGPDVRLNIAGPRASEWPNGYDVCRALLQALLAEE